MPRVAAIPSAGSRGPSPTPTLGTRQGSSAATSVISMCDETVALLVQVIDMKVEILDYMKPVDQPPRRLCQLASGVLATPITASPPASHVLWTAQGLASQGNKAAMSGLSGEPATAGNLAAQARSSIGCKRHRQRLNRSESASGHDRIASATTDYAVRRKEGLAPQLPSPKRGREATHYPETAASKGGTHAQKA